MTGGGVWTTSATSTTWSASRSSTATSTTPSNKDHYGDPPDCVDDPLSDIFCEDPRPGYEKARVLATLQTAYEWCRLVHRAGLDGTDGMLATLWVEPGGNPHPAGVPCAEAPPGRTEVTLTIDRITVLDSGDDDDNDPGEVQVAVALYDSPFEFRRSAHGQTTDLAEVDDGGDIEPSLLPAPLTLCVGDDDGVTVAVHGWDNDDDAGDPWRTEFDDKPDNEDVDEVLVGFQSRFGADRPAGSQRVVRPHRQPVRIDVLH